MNRRIGANLAQTDHFARGRVARLFQHLARGRRLRRLARINHPARNFERHLFRAVPVLLDHHHLFIRRQRDDVDPVGGFEDEEIVLAAPVRADAHVAPHAEDATVGDDLRSASPPREVARCVLRRVRVRAHASVTSTRASISVFGISAGQ
ncbi:MAG TPA: hypothetical protein VEZ40_00970 [Pyrinomonadaceae bacterium]|nr:hypothetical protein [Pyrinomonadaceae bacterium]